MKNLLDRGADPMGQATAPFPGIAVSEACPVRPAATEETAAAAAVDTDFRLCPPVKLW